MTPSLHCFPSTPYLTHDPHLYESCVCRGRVIRPDQPLVLPDGRDHQDVTIQLIILGGRRPIEGQGRVLGQRGQPPRHHLGHQLALRLGTPLVAAVLLLIIVCVIIIIVVDNLIVCISVVPKVCRCLQVNNSIAGCKPGDLILVNHFMSPSNSFMSSRYLSCLLSIHRLDKCTLSVSGFVILRSEGLYYGKHSLF